jgi:hypothetical protein
MPDAPPPPEECANCGASIPRNAKACPECGADERSGWREQSVYDDLDLPEEAWKDETEPKKRQPPSMSVNGVPWYWWMVGALLLSVLIGSVLGLM